MILFWEVKLNEALLISYLWHEKMIDTAGNFFVVILTLLSVISITETATIDKSTDEFIQHKSNEGCTLIKTLRCVSKQTAMILYD